MVEVRLNIIPITLDDPIPPPGSDYDQSTLEHTPDTAIVVAGEIGGNPAIESYIAQGFTNIRQGLTGFGCILGYFGAVTNPMIIGLATDAQRQAYPQNPGEWIIAGILEPSQILPDQWYYITLTVEGEPLELPSGIIYLICATNESWVEDPTKGWAWAGISSQPYVGPCDRYNGTNWSSIPYDMLFYTFTLTDGVVCSDYVTQTECTAAGCYWWSDNTCHSTPESAICSSYTTQAGCLAAGCFWYKKYFWEEAKCHDAEQNMMMDYLPFIIAGAGGIIIVAALVLKEKPAVAPTPYLPLKYPPPSTYYPPATNH